MRKYTLTSDALARAGENAKDMVHEWCRKEGAPSIASIVSIDLLPAKKQAIYHLARHVEVGEDGLPHINTVPLPMPIKNKPNWVDLCTMSTV